MTGRPPELDELGARLAAGRRENPTRTRARALPRLAVIAGLALAAVVPAAVATRSLWAPQVGGETALPADAPPSVRTTLQAGASDAGPWRLVGYRAELRGGGVGTCLFITAGSGGAGSCTPPTRRMVVVTHATGPVTFLAVRPREGARTVRVRWTDGHVQVVPVRTRALRGGKRVRFAAAQRSSRTGAPPSVQTIGQR